MRLLWQIVTRTGKLAYEWRGLKHLPQLLDRLVADQVSHTTPCMPLCQLFSQQHSTKDSPADPFGTRDVLMQK